MTLRALPSNTALSWSMVIERCLMAQAHLLQLRILAILRAPQSGFKLGGHDSAFQGARLHTQGGCTKVSAESAATSI